MNWRKNAPESCKLESYVDEVNAEMDRHMHELWIECWRRWAASDEGRAIIWMNECMLHADQDARDIAYRAGGTIEQFDRERLIAKVWD
jgi:hypothetical protein